MPQAYKYLPPELADRLRNLTVSVRRPVEGARQGTHRSPHHGASVEFADYREYARGDPPNRIDWAVYARTDRHVIRRYQEETNLRGYLLLDTSESMRFKEAGPVTKLEYASFLAAGLMYILINQSDAAALTLFHQAERRRFAPVGTLEGLRPMLLALEQAEPAGRSHIEEALHEIAEQVHARSLVILISDLLEEPAGILRGIQHLHHNRHEVLVLHVLDPAELQPNLTGWMELRELETGSRLIIQGDELREAYGREVERYLEELRRGCVGCLADYRLVDTQTPVEEALHLRWGRAG
jgi:uncharacterized protein (DUF58 family)